MNFVHKGNWDTELAAFLALLYLIPPAAQGKGKGSRSSISDARNLMVSYYKVANLFCMQLELAKNLQKLIFEIFNKDWNATSIHCGHLE